MFNRVSRLISNRSLFSANHIKVSPFLSFAPFRSYSEENDAQGKARTRFSLRRQKLPPFPQIERVPHLEIARLIPDNFKLVKHGDYFYKECQEGYVQIHSTAYKVRDPLHAAAGYVVYYGKDHPLNVSGPVVRRQNLKHAKLYAVLQALKSVPENSFKKVCFCVDDLTLLNFVTRHLPRLSENAFRSSTTGKLNKDLETNMELNRLLRTREDLVLQMHYIPSDIKFKCSAHAKNWAIKVAHENEKERLKKNCDWRTYQDD